MGLLLHPANPPKSDDKYVEKVLICSEVHLSELTCYKIHSLVFHEEKKSRMSNIIEKNLAKMDLELKRKSLEDLPDEILLKILGQVNIRDLIRCFFVNNKIREIAHDKSLWEKMNLRSNVDVPAELFSKLIEKGCEYLSTRFISGVEGTARFEKNSKLKYLGFEASKSTNGLTEFAASCYDLEKLSVFFRDIDQSAFDQVFKCIIQNNSTLKVLCLVDCQIMSYESMRLIVTFCQGLTDLNIRKTPISQNTMNYFCSNLTIGIEKLDISCQPTFGDDQLKTLVNRCKTLTELAFGFTNVSDESVDTIIQNLSQTLTKLQVSSDNFSFPNLLKIGSMPNLKILRVWDLPSNEKEELIKMLPHLKSSFERKKGCTRPTNEMCICDSLCIAFPYQSCDHVRNGFWEIEAKLRYY